MRGDDEQQGGAFSYITPEARIPKDHPLRAIRTMTDQVLRELSPRFAKIYSPLGRPSIPPEQLLRALLLQILYTVRSERLLDGDIAQAFFEKVLALVRAKSLLSDEHFTVDGTLVEAWAGHKSFKKKGSKSTPPDDPGNPTVDFSGE
jgi:transposase